MFPDHSWKAVVEKAEPVEVEAYLIAEIFRAMGFAPQSYWRRWLKPLVVPIVRKFSRQAIEFDRAVGEQGFSHAAQVFMSQWVKEMRIFGSEGLPRQGALVIAANHPGTFDALSMASTLPRQDVKIVATGNPFLRALPNTRKYFIFSTLDKHVRMATFRSALRHLMNDGALIIFPSGRVDPDPSHFPNAARQALSLWSVSLEFFGRKVPKANLVIAINTGFIDQKYLNNPLVHLRPSDEARQKMAEFIQVISQVIFNRQLELVPGIAFSELFSFAQILSGVSTIHEQITAIAARLLDFWEEEKL